MAATQLSDSAAQLVSQLDALRAEYKDLQQRYAQAVELVGERDEQVEELKADLTDVKHLYRDQIEFMCEQLVAATTPRGSEGGAPQMQLPTSRGAVEEEQQQQQQAQQQAQQQQGGPS